jgi:hypothetical protein
MIEGEKAALTFWLLRNGRRWIVTVLLALVSLFAFLSVTVYLVAPTQTASFVVISSTHDTFIALLYFF